MRIRPFTSQIGGELRIGRGDEEGRAIYRAISCANGSKRLAAFGIIGKNVSSTAPDA